MGMNFERADHDSTLVALVRLDIVQPLDAKPQVVTCVTIEHADVPLARLRNDGSSSAWDMNEQPGHRLKHASAASLCERYLTRVRFHWRIGDVFLGLITAKHDAHVI